MDTQKLKDQIWITRMSRINAEKRLQNKERFVDAMNIYYSCYTVIVSIALLLKQSDVLNLLIIAMSIILLVSILHFKSLRYSERALAFRDNYTELQRLELKLSHSITEAEVKEIEDQYCNLMKSGENHITFDYAVAYARSPKGYQSDHPSKWNSVTLWWGKFWRLSVQVGSVILPVFLTILAVCSELKGWFRVK